MDFTPGAGGGADSGITSNSKIFTPTEYEQKMYVTIICVILIFFIMQLITTIYDIIKKTPNNTPRIWNNIKNLIIFTLIITILMILPTSTYFESIVKALR